MKTGNTKKDQPLKPAKKNPVESGDSERRTFSIEEAGRILGISRQSAYTYASAGILPVIRLGNRMLVPKAALEKLLSAS
jgi:excisionase family DNA binding protein